jgi:outer membrane protein assembly factor BamB
MRHKSLSIGPLLAILLACSLLLALDRSLAVGAFSRGVLASLPFHLFVPVVSVGQTSNAGGWLTYHADAVRSGRGPDTPLVDKLNSLWTAPLDGEVYAEPLVASGKVVVATENDTVFALDFTTGAVAWRQHVGDPVPLASLPCGNIDPSGMTSTPVIDPAAGLVYAVGRMQPTHHELIAFDLATGAIRFRRTIDPPGVDPSALQQRAALSLANGRVYIPFGGNAGDCGAYRGWVVSVPADGQGDTQFWGVPTAKGGAIWAPSGGAIDASGNLFVSTGNAASNSAFDDGNAVVELSPDLQPVDVWAPADWAELSEADADIGSIGPVLLENGRLFQSGKNGTGYLLDPSRLGGVGGQLYTGSICPGQTTGGAAVQLPFVYVSCGIGIVALRITGDSFAVNWQSASGSAPIIAYGSIWTIDIIAAQLLQLDPQSGAVRQSYDLGDGIVAHFITPTAFNGEMVVPAGQQVIAFAAP